MKAQAIRHGSKSVCFPVLLSYVLLGFFQLIFLISKVDDHE